MKFSAVAIFAGAAAASYLPEPVSSSAPAYVVPSSSAPAYVKPSSSAPAYVKPSSSAPAYVKPASSAAPVYSHKSETTTIECEGPTTFTYNKKTYTATTATSFVVDCEETEVAEVTTYAAAKPTYAPVKPVYPAANGTATYVPSASPVKSSGPLEVTTNAAVNNVAGAGAALAGVFGAVAYLL